MTYPPEWPEPGKLHFRLVHERLGVLDLDCDSGYVVNQYNLGFPEVREVKLPNSLDDGNFDVTRFFGARAVSLDVTMKPHSGITPASSRLSPEAVLRDKLLGYVYPGIRSRLLFSEHGDKRVRQILIRGASASLAVSKPDYNKVNVSWVAPRGTLYSYDERCYTYVFSETSGDVMELIIVNEGTVPVDWRASISGYSIHPRFILNGREILRLEYEAGPGDVITLDSFSRTITINGQPASYAYIEDDSTWFKVPPGMSSLVVSHQGGVTGAGYPYARWQVPMSSPLADLFDRADGPLGDDWDEPADLPADTVAVPLAIDDGAVVVTEPDGGAVPHEWGFARNVTAITGGVGMYAEIDVTNLAQSSAYGPVARSRAEVYTNMRDTDAACQVLSVDFDYGIMPTPVAPLVLQDPFEDLANWTVAGDDVSLVAGRNGTAMQLTGTATTATLAIPPASVSATVLVGAAVKLTGSVSRGLFEFRSDAGITLHGRVAVDGTGAIYAVDAAGAIRVQSPAGLIVIGTWNYVEVRSVLSDTAGLLELWVNGNAVGSVFDIDTNATFAAAYDAIRLPAGTSGSVQYDDFYLAVDTDAPLGPQDVPNGSLAWEMHQYDTGGVSVNTVASGTVPYTFGAAPVRLRLESGTDGEQRFLLNTLPVAAAVEAAAVVGTLTGFGLTYETVEYDLPEPGVFSDDFERAALGPDWVLPTARTTGKTTVLPTISAGAAVVTAHTAVYPTQFYSATTIGSTLVGGAVQNMPSFMSAGYLLIARVLQDNPAGVLITASTGWTQIGTRFHGTAGTEVIRMTAFARVCDGTSNDNLTVTGAATAYVAAVEVVLADELGGGAGGFVAADIAKLRLAAADGATGFADPPSLTLGASRDWLFLTCGGLDTTTTPSMGGSSGYSNIHGTTVAPGNLCAMRSGYRQATLGGAENPAAYTGTSDRPWIAFTIAVPGNPTRWGGAEHVGHEYSGTETVAVEAVVHSTAGSGTPFVELYTHMVAGSPTCRALQVELVGRTWKMGHYAGGDDLVVAASGALPVGAYPVTLRFESDDDGTERFLFNGTVVQSVVDATAPVPVEATRVGFGEFWATSSGPQIRSFASTGTPFVPPVGVTDPTSPRIERFAAAAVSGANWAIPDRVVPATDPNNPRAGAARIEEDYWFQVGVDVSTSPNGAALADYRGTGAGLFIYTDGWTFDGYGWRDNLGRTAYADGAVVTSTVPATFPPNNPAPAGRPPWAWTPPVDPITGEPSILTVHFCFYDQWL